MIGRGGGEPTVPSGSVFSFFRCVMTRFVLPTAAVAFLLGVLGLPAFGQQELRLDVFSKTHSPNTAIPGWDSRKIAPFFGSGDRFFFQFVHKSDQEHYLHLKSGKNNSFSVGSEQRFKLQDWPILEWEWKVTQFPKGGDVRVKALDDQAGAICVVVNPGLVGFDSLCYLWENDGPKETPITSSKRDDSKYLILRTAKADPTGDWVKERRNILEDYKRLFGREPTKEAVIGVQIDSDDTASSAEAFYRAIFLRKR